MNALSKAPSGLAGPAIVSPYRRVSPNLLQSIGLSIWGALESFGRRRAMRELHELAERWQSTDPELARCLRAAVDDSSASPRGSAR